MTVSCEGDCVVVEKLGEKQDFETELTRRGYRHEDFTLQVTKQARRGKSAVWSQDYAVTVFYVPLSQAKVYRGGPAYQWVRQCMTDFDRGVFGPSVAK